MEKVLLAARQSDDILALSKVHVADYAVRLQHRIRRHFIFGHRLTLNELLSGLSFGAEAHETAESKAQQRHQSYEQQKQDILYANETLQNYVGYGNPFGVCREVLLREADDEHDNACDEPQLAQRSQFLHARAGSI